LTVITPAIPPKEKFDFIDLLKAIASYFVIIYHFNYIDIDFLKKAGAFQYFNYYITTILPICVPIFFLVNGALLLNKRELNIKRHILKIVDFVVLVIVWAVITYVIMSFLYHERIVLADIIKSIYILKQGWTNHLWFLEALVVLYIFYPLLYTAFNQNRIHFYFFFVCAAILTLGNTLIVDVATIISYVSNQFTCKDLNKNFFSAFNTFQVLYGYSIVYFMLGGLMIYYKEHFNSTRLRIIAAFTIPLAMGLQFLFGVITSKRQNEIWDCVWHGHDTLFTLLMVVSLFILLLRYKHQGLPGKIIAVIGQNSLGIYFLHIIVAELTSPILFSNTSANDFFTNGLRALLILAMSLIITIGMKKIPILKYLVSIK
jgi:surface polysaccharide O-acyltransferase-like enzyme